MTTPGEWQPARVIIYAHPGDFENAVKAARWCLEPGYEWRDNYAVVSFYAPGEEPWKGERYSVRRNKTGVTVYGPRRDHSAPPEASA